MWLSVRVCVSFVQHILGARIVQEKPNHGIKGNVGNILRQFENEMRQEEATAAAAAATS